MHHPSPAVSADGRPAGLTLLEVLVSCGILAIGLASVAALLPAAGSRFAQATQADRAGALAASVRAELVSRGLVAADVVGTASSPSYSFRTYAGGAVLTGSGSPPSYAFGEVLTALNTANSTLMTSTAANAAPWRTWNTFIATSPSPVVAQRLDTSTGGRGLALDDDLVYLTSSTATNPVNSFAADGRAFNPGLRWGATVIPNTLPAAPGAAATLSVAVFRKADGVARELRVMGSAGAAMFPCTGVLMAGVTGTVHSGSSALTPTGTCGFQIDAARRLVLQPCTSVLALTSPQPQWVRVTSSWMIRGPTITTASGTTEDTRFRRSFVVLDPNPITSSTTQELRIIGFEGLLRVDHYPVTLD